MSGLLFFATILVFGGVASGLMAGMFGVGGGAVLVPVLYEVLGMAGIDDAIRTHLAVGTSLAVILPTGIRSTMGHNEKGSVDWTVVKTMGPFIVVGVFFGTLIARVAEGEQLRLIYGVTVIFVAMFLLWSRYNPSMRMSWPPDWFTRLYGVINGTLSTLMGIGGGTFTTSFMTAFGRTIHQAVGTAAALGPIIAFPAIFGFIWAGYGNPLLPTGSLGFVSLIGMVLILPTSLLAAPYGVRLAHRLTRPQLELFFAIFLLTVGVRFLWSVFV